MNPYKIHLMIITLILLIAGCREKDELTRPVKVTLNIAFSTKGDWDPFDKYCYFTEGHIGIQKILFDGKREAGGDVFFETDPNISLSTFKLGLLPTIISVFDLPQGIYNYMKWDIYMKKIVTDELIDDNDSDSQNIGLVIKGYYDDWIWDEESDSIPFIFALDYTDQFSVRSCDVYNNSRIVLSENKDYEAILSLDLFSAFNSVSLSSFQEAEISGDSEHPLIIISSSKNKDLYEILSYRIVQYAKVVVK